MNPSTGRRIFSIPAGSATDVERAVVSARRAFQDGRWSDAPPSFRKKTLHQFAELISQHSEELNALDAEEMGKPLSVAFASASAAAGLMRFCAEAVDKVTGEVISSDKDSLVTQRRVPRGVVAAVVPWNFPTYNAAMKLAPALAAGNSVIVKPSELACRSAGRLAELAIEAGVPPGIVNVVPGKGEIVGRALALHSDVDMVAFTGSTVTGKQILQYAGQSNLKVVLAECGGKSPHVVFDDGIDLDTASEAIAQFLLTNQGQICSVGSRLLVARSIKDAMLEKIVARLGAVVIGDALDPGTTFGPLASAGQLSRVLHYIETAESDGARLVAGGRRIRLETGGYFIEPTVFADVAERAKIAQEEIFGPVLSVTTFEDETEAVRLANATAYGLAAFVWTTNLSRGMRVAKAIRSPVIVNANAQKGEGPGHAASWEPVGQSGIGREGGLGGIQSYLRQQLIWFNHS